MGFSIHCLGHTLIWYAISCAILIAEALIIKKWRDKAAPKWLRKKINNLNFPLIQELRR